MIYRHACHGMLHAWVTLLLVIVTATYNVGCFSYRGSAIDIANSSGITHGLRGGGSLQSVQHKIKLQGVLHPWRHQFGKQQAPSDKPTRLVTKSVAPTRDTPETPSQCRNAFLLSPDVPELRLPV